MTPEILYWLETIRDQVITQPGRVLEVGSQDFNGSPRVLFADAATEYIGTDMQTGAGVDVLLNNADLLATFGAESFDTVICCECLEHDEAFWDTVEQMRDMVKSGGYLVITTPTYGFPVHRYPRDYWRFGEDAFREVFFNGWHVVNLMHLNSNVGKHTTLAGVAQKP